MLLYLVQRINVSTSALIEPTSALLQSSAQPHPLTINEGAGAGIDTFHSDDTVHRTGGLIDGQ